MKGTLTLLFQKMKSRLFSGPCSSINYCLLFVKARGQALVGGVIIHPSLRLCSAPLPCWARRLLRRPVKHSRLKILGRVGESEAKAAICPSDI